MWFDVPGTGASTVFCAAVDAHSGAVAACCDSGRVVVSAGDSAPGSGKVLESGSGEALRAAWHPDGGALATGNADGLVRVHRLAAYAPAAAASHDEEVYACDFMSESTLLTGWGERVALWDVGGADLRQSASMAFAPLEQSSAAFGGERNPNGRVYVFSAASAGCVACVALSDGTVRLVDARSLGADVLALKSHPRAATSCTFAQPRGSEGAEGALSTVVASTGMDGSVTAWDLRQTAGPLVASVPHEGSAMTCCPVGGSLLTGGLDGTVVASPLETGQTAESGGAGAGAGEGAAARRVVDCGRPVLSLHCAGGLMAVGLQSPCGRSGGEGHSHGDDRGHDLGHGHGHGVRDEGGDGGTGDGEGGAQYEGETGAPGAIVASLASEGLHDL